MSGMIDIKKGLTFYNAMGGEFSIKITIIDVVKDGEKELIVTKRWFRGKQIWHYEVEEKWLVEINFKNELYVLEKMKG